MLNRPAFSAATVCALLAFGCAREEVASTTDEAVTYMMTARDGKSAPHGMRLNFVARWAHQPDGVWRIDRFMETPMPPAAAPGKAAG